MTRFGRSKDLRWWTHHQVCLCGLRQHRDTGRHRFRCGVESGDCLGAGSGEVSATGGTSPVLKRTHLLLLVLARSVGSSQQEKIPVDAPLQLNGPISRQEQRSLGLKVSMDEAMTRLARQLTEGHSEDYQDFLRFYSRFWTYSVRNTMLIHAQCPQATRCAGLRLWNKMGYHVKRGEHCIWLWAPMFRKELDQETGEIVELVAGFVPAPVFDASQLVEIEERPLPAPYPVLPDDATEAYDLCVAKIRAQGIAVEETIRLPHGVMGLSRPGQIVIDNRQDSRNRLFTLIHELVHQTWHHDLQDPAATQQQLEFEAESVTYVVASVVGLEHPSARDYLLNYQVTAERLLQSLAIIQVMVRHLLRILELPFDVMHQPEALAA